MPSFEVPPRDAWPPEELVGWSSFGAGAPGRMALTTQVRHKKMSGRSLERSPSDTQSIKHTLYDWTADAMGEEIRWVLCSWDLHNLYVVNSHGLLHPELLY